MNFFTSFFTQQAQQTQSQSNDEIRVPRHASEETTAMLANLTMEQKCSLCQSCADSLCVTIFAGLTADEQCHIFPLLSKEKRSLVINVVDETQQNRLVEHYNACYEQSERFREDPNSADSFFYYMNFHNAQRKMGDGNVKNKVTYVLSADKLLMFDLQPYKFQRKLIERHIQNIAQGIQDSKMLYHPIICAYEKKHNRITILDGQHRWNALKLVDTDIVKGIDVQIDVILFDSEDADIMECYKHINTSMPIDPSRLAMEMRYVQLIDRCKKEFKGIMSFDTLNPKREYPKHFVIDTFLKEQLQIREILDKFSEDEIIQRLKAINSHISLSKEVDAYISQLERRACTRDGMWLGIDWPSSIDILEGKKATVGGTNMFLLSRKQ